MNLHYDIKKVLVSEEKLAETVKRISAEIARDYANTGKKLLLLGILIEIPVEIDFMKVSSYGRSTVSSGTVNIILDLYRKDLADLDILVIEDIIDSGITLSYLCEYLKLKGAHSVRTCTLLDKPSRRKVDFQPDYVGLEIPDEFVVGYGLDYDEQYRTLPYVGVLKPDVYNQ